MIIAEHCLRTYFVITKVLSIFHRPLTVLYLSTELGLGSVCGPFACNPFSSPFEFRAETGL